MIEKTAQLIREKEIAEDCILLVTFYSGYETIRKNYKICSSLDKKTYHEFVKKCFLLLCAKSLADIMYVRKR